VHREIGVVIRIEAACTRLIEKSVAMCTALAPRNRYDVASEIAKTAYHENRTDCQIAREVVGVDPVAMTARLGQADSAAAVGEEGGFPSMGKRKCCLTHSTRRSVEPACRGGRADDRGV
jgi:fumarate hydratase class II